MKFNLELTENELKTLYILVKQKEEGATPAVTSLLRMLEKVVFQWFTIEELESILRIGEGEK